MIKNSKGETIVTWQMMLVIVLTSSGIFLGGVSSGYFLRSAEYQHQADAQAKTLSRVDKKIDQLPARTAEAVKEDDGK